MQLLIVWNYAITYSTMELAQNAYIKMILFFTSFSLRIAGSAACDQATTFLDPQIQTTILKNEVPNGSN